MALSLIEQLAGATQNQAPAKKEDRKKSDFWLNVGITLKGKDGEDVFVSLPNCGIALDDVKPVEVRGSNEDFIQLQQTKNMLLELIQKNAAGLKPGEHVPVKLEVQLLRRAEPAAAGDASTNPLLASLLERVG